MTWVIRRNQLKNQPQIANRRMLHRCNNYSLFSYTVYVQLAAYCFAAYYFSVHFIQAQFDVNPLKVYHNQGLNLEKSKNNKLLRKKPNCEFNMLKMIKFQLKE